MQVVRGGKKERAGRKRLDLHANRYTPVKFQVCKHSVTVLDRGAKPGIIAIGIGARKGTGNTNDLLRPFSKPQLFTRLLADNIRSCLMQHCSKCASRKTRRILTQSGNTKQIRFCIPLFPSINWLCSHRIYESPASSSSRKPRTSPLFAASPHACRANGSSKYCQ